MEIHQMHNNIPEWCGSRTKHEKYNKMIITFTLLVLDLAKLFKQMPLSEIYDIHFDLWTNYLTFNIV